tara:strand:- start:34270 stop:34683 length:414 start_codon:yes stop_codon:yes gene_type:complete
MADKNYLKQTQGDADSAEALKHTRVIGFSLTNGEVSDYFYPGNARSITWISSTGSSKTDGVAAMMRQAAASASHEGDGASSGTAASNVAFFLDDAPNTVAYGGTAVGFLAGTHIPHEMALKNLHGSSTAAVTVYINY